MVVVGGHNSVELSIRNQISGLVADPRHSGLTQLLQSTLVRMRTSIISNLCLGPNVFTVLGLLDREALLGFPFGLFYIFVYRILKPLKIKVLKLNNMLVLDLLLDPIMGTCRLIPQTITLLKQLLFRSQEVFSHRVILLIEGLLEHCFFVDPLG